jgi:hypothetical protein
MVARGCVLEMSGAVRMTRAMMTMNSAGEGLEVSIGRPLPQAAFAIVERHTLGYASTSEWS